MFDGGDGECESLGHVMVCVCVSWSRDGGVCVCVSRSRGSCDSMPTDI